MMSSLFKNIFFLSKCTKIFVYFIWYNNNDNNNNINTFITTAILISLEFNNKILNKTSIEIFMFETKCWKKVLYIFLRTTQSYFKNI